MSFGSDAETRPGASRRHKSSMPQQKQGAERAMRGNARQNAAITTLGSCLGGQTLLLLPEEKFRVWDRKLLRALCKELAGVCMYRIQAYTDG